MGWQDAPVTTATGGSWKDAPISGAAPAPTDKYANMSFGDKVANDARSMIEGTKRVGLLGAKSINDSLVHLLTLAPDAVTSAVNLATKQHTPTIGEQYQAVSDSDVAPAQNAGERLLSGAVSAAAGTKIPFPASPASNTTSALQQTAEMARGAGYKLPPSAIPNSGFLSRALEKIGGGPKPINAAVSAGNRAQTADNIAAELQLPAGTEITPATIDAVRSNAWTQGYKPIEDLGGQYKDIVGTIRKAREDVRKYYNDYARNGTSEKLDLARAAQTSADNAESVLAGSLKQMDRPDLYDAYTKARTTIAKASDVERNLVESTGEIKASGLAREFGKGSPQSGAIEAAGRVGQANPKAFSTAAEPSSLTLGDKFAGLGSAAGITASALSHDPRYAELGLALAGAKLGIGGLKAGIRKGLTTNFMQDQMTLLTPEQKRALLSEALLRSATATNQGQ